MGRCAHCNKDVGLENLIDMNYCSDECGVKSLELHVQHGLRKKITHDNGVIEYTRMLFRGE